MKGFEKIDNENSIKQTTENILNEAESIVLEYNPDGKILTENGHISNLSERPAKIIRTPSFLKWFGDYRKDFNGSPVTVGSNGEPRIFFHRSHTELESFNERNVDFGVSSRFTHLYTKWRSENINQRYGEYVHQTFVNIPKIRVVIGAMEYYDVANGKVGFPSNVDDEYYNWLREGGYGGIYCPKATVPGASHMYEDELVCFEPEKNILILDTETLSD